MKGGLGDATAVAGIFECAGTLATKKGAVTPFGRWFLAQPADAAAEVARGGAIAKLVRLQIAGGDDVAVKATIAAFKPEKKQEGEVAQDLATALVGVDPRRFEAEIETLTKSFEKAYNFYALGKEYLAYKELPLRERGWSHLRTAVEKPSESTGSLVVEDALEIDARNALELARVARIPDTGARLGTAGKLLRTAGAKAVPIVVDWLCEPWDTGTEYGFVTHQKYVQRTFAMLAKYDVEPFADRVRRAFAKEKDKKVKKAVEAGLGAKKPKPIPFQAPKKCYAFETYAAEIGKEVVALARKHRAKLPAMIDRIKLETMPEAIQVMGVSLSGKGDTTTWELEGPETKIPNEPSGDEALLRRIFVRHGFSRDDDELPGWGDSYELPGCAYVYELLEEAGRIAAALRKAGLKIAKEPKLEAFEWDASEDWLGRIHAGLQVAGGNAVLVRELAALLYATPAKRKWIEALAREQWKNCPECDSPVSPAAKECRECGAKT